MKRLLLSLLTLACLSTSSQVSALGGDDTTYVRCWYEADSSHSNVEAAWVWALDPDSGRAYAIRGNWFDGGPMALQNMFYTDTPAATLKSVCESTLRAKGIAQPLTMVAAADMWSSLNYTIWSNDPPGQPTGIHKVVVFGDSVSDNGNLWNATGWIAPQRDSWFLGRFSNGKVWSEYLSDNLGLPNYTWAVGGAAGDAYFVVPGVVQQVKSYLAYMDSAPNYQPANTLFTMLIGANDIIAYGRTADAAIAAEQTALEELIASGARNILVGNLPDLWKAPEFALRSDGAAMKIQIDAFNAQLPTMIAALEATSDPTLNIVLLDIKAGVDDILADPESYGLTNTTQSCLDLSENSTADYARSHPLRTECFDPDQFLFWDLLHPTTRAHSLIGAMATSVAEAHFPL